MRIRTRVSSQIPRLRRRRLEVVVASIDIGHRERGELFIREIVQTADDNGDELTVGRRAHVRKRLDPASLAEHVIDAVGAEVVLAERVLALQEAKVGTIDGDQPVAALAADRAVASHCSLTEVDVGFVADRATMAAAGMGLFHRNLLGGLCGRRSSSRLADTRSVEFFLASYCNEASASGNLSIQ